ncbi:MAG: nucleotide exchange factor GrpE [Solirubrobacterales bacterium]|nr:nucleotide exchange factor GrpE [Solirubrobacterales bacterium]
MSAEQGPPRPDIPGREAEEMSGFDSAQPSPDPDRNLTPSGAGEGPAAAAQGPPNQNAAGQVEQDLDALLADTQKERDEYLDLARRTKADFENYRKRMSAEVQGANARGKAEMAVGMIGVIDNLERALAAAGIDAGADQAPEEPLAQGILLTHRELCAVLERGGIEGFDPKGEKFDPTWQEALSKLAVEGTGPGIVVETMQKGYRFGDQLIRPARVVVSE